MTVSQIVVIDTETTGLEPAEGAALLEVAWVAVTRDPEGRWVYGEEGTYGSSMIEYTGEIPTEARAVHHISPEMVAPGARGCEPLDSLLHSLLAAEDPGDMMYCAHNADFDQKFLSDLTLPWMCSYRAAMHLLPDAPKHSNMFLRYHLGAEPPAKMLLEEGTVQSVILRSGEVHRYVPVSAMVPLSPHRALYDAACTAAVLCTFLEGRTPEELLALRTAPVLLKTCRFGKHRGQLWSELPRDYLSWMVRSSDMMKEDQDIAHTVRHYLG